MNEETNLLVVIAMKRQIWCNRNRKICIRLFKYSEPLTCELIGQKFLDNKTISFLGLRRMYLNENEGNSYLRILFNC